MYTLQGVASHSISEPAGKPKKNGAAVIIYSKEKKRSLMLSAILAKKKGWLGGGVDERQTDESSAGPLYIVESVVDIRARTEGKRCHLQP